MAPFDLTAHQLEQLHRLLSAVRAGRCAMVLTGVSGTGKSMVLRRVHENVSQLGKTSFLLHSPLVDVETTLAACRYQLAASDEEDRAPPGAGQNDQVVLLIDNADRWSPQLFGSTLCHAEGDRGRSWQLLLGGGPKLKAMVDTLDFNGHVPFVAELHPLAQVEIDAYLSRVLPILGRQEKILASQEARSMMARHSSGVPGRINELCCQALSLAREKGDGEVSADTVAQALERWREGEAYSDRMAHGPLLECVRSARSSIPVISPEVAIAEMQPARGQPLKPAQVDSSNGGVKNPTFSQTTKHRIGSDEERQSTTRDEQPHSSAHPRKRRIGALVASLLLLGGCIATAITFFYKGPPVFARATSPYPPSPEERAPKTVESRNVQIHSVQADLVPAPLAATSEVVSPDAEQPIVSPNASPPTNRSAGVTAELDDRFSSAELARTNDRWRHEDPASRARPYAGVPNPVPILPESQSSDLMPTQGAVFEELEIQSGAPLALALSKVAVSVVELSGPNEREPIGQDHGASDALELTLALRAEVAEQTMVDPQPQPIGDSAITCTIGQETRRVEIHRPNEPNPVPCDVGYFDDVERPDGWRTLWSAKHDPAFCSSKAQGLIATLEEHGWVCDAAWMSSP